MICHSIIKVFTKLEWKRDQLRKIQVVCWHKLENVLLPLKKDDLVGSCIGYYVSNHMEALADLKFSGEIRSGLST